MAQKKAILINLESDFTGKVEKIAQKALKVLSYEKGDLEGIETATVCTLETLKDAKEDFLTINISQEGDLEKILECIDRQSTLAIVANNTLLLYGYGIGKIQEISRKVFSKDIIPTLAYIVNFPVSADATGAVIYQALKDPNLPSNEISKLKLALERMEAAMAREHKEPWDKHDCA